MPSRVPLPGAETDVADDQRLAAEVLAKDRKATAAFVSRCADVVYPFVRRRLLPRSDLVEDLVQEILLAAWQSLAKFRGEAGLRAWVLGIARHKVEDYYRKRLLEPGELEEDAEAESAVPPVIEQYLEMAADRKKVENTLAQLPEAYALALLWRYRDGRSTREMAQLTGKTEKAIERLLARARQGFRRRWTGDEP